jgi:lysophospholipase L1-like esterase
MPGAYMKAVVNRSATLRLAIDGTANAGCPPTSMPVIEWSVDGGPFTILQLSAQDAVYELPLAKDLSLDRPHQLEVYFRAANLCERRWESSVAHLRIAALVIDKKGELTAWPRRAKLAIGYGDSITEGVGVDALFTSWSKLAPNNARCSWLPLVCEALDSEYGQLGSGGQGMSVTTMQLPPLGATWDHYDAGTSRLAHGRLVPEPDYVFCAMGTNDFGKDITVEYGAWLTAMRAACPHAQIFCVVPLLGFHRSEITAAVNGRMKMKDRRVHLIDLATLEPAFSPTATPTRLAFDGVHPSQYGNALVAAHVLARVMHIVAK